MTGKIKKSHYEELKNNYLSKNRTLHSLYIELNQKTTVDRHLFFNLINKIRTEEGLSAYYIPTLEKRTAEGRPDLNPGFPDA